MRGLFAGLALLLAACASAPHAPDPPLIARFVSGLEGRFDNAVQWDAAPDNMRRAPAAGHPYDWIDWQAAVFHRVEAPLIGADVVYLEWRSGGPDGPISRQRIWALREDAAGHVRMDFFTFRDPAPYAGRGHDAGAFAGLTPVDLIGYGPDCGLYVSAISETGFAARITPQTCAIIARSGRRMGILAQIALNGDRLSYTEAGVLDDGSYAFLVPAGTAYLFDRQP